MRADDGGSREQVHVDVDVAALPKPLLSSFHSGTSWTMLRPITAHST